MPGLIVHFGATVMCTHAGQATPSAGFPRVTVSGQPVITQPTPYVVTGCTLPPPTAANGPCVTGQWLTGSVRVLAGSMPLVLMDSQSICAPTGTPMVPTLVQSRVIAT
ncbi:MAG: hypothetical protein GY763_11990 [Gammaproteobacteria bacterium]|nr:hypothetical protein [Gammaproteobacteria bacterium]